jgi:hypothetical protein
VFFSRRAQAVTNQGRIHEVRYAPHTGIVRAVLFNGGGSVSDVGGFHTSDDDFRHAVLATPDGDVKELFFRP